MKPRILYLATADARGHLMRAQLLSRALIERGAEVRVLTTSVVRSPWAMVSATATESLSGRVMLRVMVTASTMPRLEEMQFAVLAIGDTGYDGFCQAGKFFDMRLEQLGAKRLADRLDCDVDFEGAASEWIGRTLPMVQPEPGSGGGGAAPAGPAPKPALPGSSRKNPFASRLLTNRLLSGGDSGKDIRHFEGAPVAQFEVQLSHPGEAVADAHLERGVRTRLPLSCTEIQFTGHGVCRATGALLEHLKEREISCLQSSYGVGPALVAERDVVQLALIALFQS